jgi:sugar/nucleoside kinase (ribokinase family)
MTVEKDFDLLLVGHFAKDRNIVDGVGKTESGGGVYFGAMVACRMGLRVAIATRLHRDDFFRLDEIKRVGIKVFATPAPETSGIENSYQSTDMERRICKPLGFAGAFQIADLPEINARINVIAPIIAGEVDLPLLKWLAARAPVALDIQGFVRVRDGNQLVFRQWNQMADGLKHVTYLKVDRAEAELLTGETDLKIAAKKLRSYGPKEIVLTQSTGVTVFADGEIHTAPFTPRSLAGRTGRGDTCFSAYLGKRLSALPAEACRFAAAVTTLKQEKPGPWNGTMEEIISTMNYHAQLHTSNV